MDKDRMEPALAALMKAITNMPAAIQLGKDILKDVTLEDCCAASEKHQVADQELALHASATAKKHGIPRIELGKMLINIGLAAWGAEIMIQRETASN